MEITLTHPAVSRCKVWYKLLDDCDTLSRFCGRIDRFATKIAQEPSIQNPFFIHSENEDWTKKTTKDLANKFKGDIFEIFCELLIKLSPIDDRIGISNYQVVTDGDTGVDGYGIARDGTPATVQIKYRLWDYSLDHIREHLNNFRITSYRKYHVNPDAENKMIVVTTGKEINWKTLNEQFGGKVRCISRDASYGCLKGAQKKTIDSLFSLQTLVDNNLVFWKLFQDKVVSHV
jgi:hypothetical protein